MTVTLPFWVLLLIIAGTACVVLLVDITQAANRKVDQILAEELRRPPVNDQEAADLDDRGQFGGSVPPSPRHGPAAGGGL